MPRRAGPARYSITPPTHGLLLLQAGPDVLRFVPPLTITGEELADGLDRLHAALADFVGA